MARKFFALRDTCLLVARLLVMLTLGTALLAICWPLVAGNAAAKFVLTILGFVLLRLWGLA